MEIANGIGQTNFSTENLDQQANHNPEWVTATTLGRWHKYGGKRPPMTPRRVAAIRAKRAFERYEQTLSSCLSGDELLAERRHAGDGTSFAMAPRTDHARELVALLPTRRLRWPHTQLLAALAYAMLVRGKQGLVATHAELGAFCSLRETAVGDAMRVLVALGFVTREPTFVEFGACSSQRANLWRLTRECVDGFGLLGPLHVPAGVVLPTGTVDRARLQRRRRPVGSRACVTPRNPEANPDALCTPSETRTPSGMAPALPGCVVSPSATVDCRTAVPAGRAGEVKPATRQGATRDASRKAPDGDGREFVDELASLVSVPWMRDAMLAATKKGGRS